MHVGESGAWLLTIERSGESVHLVVSDIRNPTDRYEYEAPSWQTSSRRQSRTPLALGGAASEVGEWSSVLNPTFREASLETAMC
jgi:hypothetical protein